MKCSIVNLFDVNENIVMNLTFLTVVVTIP
jgi:hypothetical protein